jgi:hypothetical protein
MEPPFFATFALVGRKAGDVGSKSSEAGWWGGVSPAMNSMNLYVRLTIIGLIVLLIYVYTDDDLV